MTDVERIGEWCKENGLLPREGNRWTNGDRSESVAVLQDRVRVATGGILVFQGDYVDVERGYLKLRGTRHYAHTTDDEGLFAVYIDNGKIHMDGPLPEDSDEGRD
jgi:hypothetical protein